MSHVTAQPSNPSQHDPCPVPDHRSDRYESPARLLSQRLAEHAEAVCRHYLSAGRREGRYWIVGDIYNTPGRSLYVRLSLGIGVSVVGKTTNRSLRSDLSPSESDRTHHHAGTGAAGKWTDAATGEHGDLLDLIKISRRLGSLQATFDEARRFLGLPREADTHPDRRAAYDAVAAARRLWTVSQPLKCTLAETYLKKRGILQFDDCRSLRFHPRCSYRADRADIAQCRKAWPALIAAVTDDDGKITGIHRTWLDPSGTNKAPIATPRRSLGSIVGHGVRFGRFDRSTDVIAAGEGIETVLSLRMAVHALPSIAALSAGHLAALSFPPSLRRLYVIEDNDAAGRQAADRLADRARSAGIEAIWLKPMLADLNDDLVRLGITSLRDSLMPHLLAEDRTRFAA
ncbi:MAG: toprim domain-containing protein [Beijerinckiaceae bacterium]|nr:toprim domain-containing protein [Beijerinckiaceae bacterium]